MSSPCRVASRVSHTPFPSPRFLPSPPTLPPPTPLTRSTVEGATLGLTKILGGCWALTYLALVVGNPKFQTMLDPSLLAAQDTPVSVSAIAVSGGGRSGGNNAGFHRHKTGASTNRRVGTEDVVVAGGGGGAGAAEGGRRGFGVVRAFRRWAERRGRRRDSHRRRQRRRAGVCGDELESSGGSARVAAPVLVRAGK